MGPTMSKIVPNQTRALNGENTRQIDFGCYTIYQSNVIVGKVCVVPASEDAAMGGSCTAGSEATSASTLPEDCVEHWCLYSTYKPPSGANRSMALTFQYSDRDPDITCFADFVTHAVAQPNARYIRAECRMSDPSSLLQMSRG